MERIDFKINEEGKKDIVKMAYEFSLRILYLFQELPNNPLTYKIISQLIGSGTSIGSNTEEASAGFSKSDFIFKMSIASKEAREVNYWLRLLRDSGLIKDRTFFKEVLDAIDESNQIKKILTSVVKTSQGKLRSKDKDHI